MCVGLNKVNVGGCEGVKMWTRLKLGGVTETGVSVAPKQDPFPQLDIYCQYTVGIPIPNMFGIGIVQVCPIAI